MPVGTRDATGEHEASRRMKTELLVQMDGLLSNHNSSISTPQANIDSEEGQNAPQVFVLAASNHPWDLDGALLRRLEKRIMVPLPDETARLEMVKAQLVEGKNASGIDYEEVARRTMGYSGADIVLVCKESAMRPVRRLMAKLKDIELVTLGTPSTNVISNQRNVTISGTGGVGASDDRADRNVALLRAMVLNKGGSGDGDAGLGAHEYPEVEKVSQADVDAALACTNPSTSRRYVHVLHISIYHFFFYLHRYVRSSFH